MYLEDWVSVKLFQLCLFTTLLVLREMVTIHGIDYYVFIYFKVLKF